ncbi:MAG: DUF6338 family protein, partial [Phycisphaerales bacterium JB043]
ILPKQFDQNISERYFKYAIYSVLNYGLWWPLLLQSVLRDFTSNSTDVGSIASMLLIAIVSPFIGGCISGIFIKADLLASALKRLKIDVKPLSETAWEKAFRRTEGCVVRLSFTSECEDIYGVYNPNSYVSDQEGHHDIYLEKQLIPYDDRLVPLASSIGLWAPKDNLKTIQFYSVGALQDGYEQRQK